MERRLLRAERRNNWRDSDKPWDAFRYPIVARRLTPAQVVFRQKLKTEPAPPYRCRMIGSVFTIHRRIQRDAFRTLAKAVAADRQAEALNV